jgi:stearoyl-CoA desaturase (delta-9 desaturase)
LLSLWNSYVYYLGRVFSVVFLVLVPLIALAIAIYMTWNWLITWSDMALLVSMYIIVSFGITIGYHRFLTHGSFKTSKVLRYILVILGTMAWQGGAITWTSNHRKHHAYADEEGDVHSPHLSKSMIRGFIHAHLGWLLIDQKAEPREWSKDLLQDKGIVFIQRTTFIWFILSLLIPFALGGWTGLLWGGFVRILLSQHVTFSVNSVCHIYGSRPFQTKDRSTNHWLVGLLALGEGGHNTHHASPRSARHGIKWWHFDTSWKLIWLLGRLGLVWDVYDLNKTDLLKAIKDKASGVKASIRKDMGSKRFFGAASS